jgi:phage-related protein
MATTQLKAVISLDNQISSGLNKIEQDFSKLNKSVGKAVSDSLNKVSKFGDNIEKVGKNISLKLTAPLVAGLSLVSAQAINQVKQVQNASFGLKAYEQDAGKVTNTLKELVKYAQSDAGVLFQRQDLFQAASTLKIYGNETDTLVDKVKILSKGVSLGTTTFAELSDIIGRSTAEGKLSSDSFDMLTRRGIKLDRSLRNSSIGADELFKALDKALPDDLLEGRATTIEGQMIRLQSALRNVGASFLGVNKDADGFMPGSIGERIFETVDKIRQFARSEEFLDAVKQAAERVGQAFDFISTAVSKLYDYYKNLSPEQKKLLTDIVLLAAALGPVLIAVGGFIKVMAAVLKPVLMVGGAIFKLGAFILGMNPIVLAIIAVIGTLAGIAYLVITNWELVKTRFAEVFNNIKKTVSEAWDNVKRKSSEVWQNVKTTVSNVWNSIKTAVSNALNFIKNIFTTAWNSVVEIVTKAIEAIIWGFKNWEKVIGFIIGFVLGIFIQTFLAIGKAFGFFIGIIITGFVRAFDMIKNAILGIPTFISNTWNLITGIWNAGTTWLSNKTREVINAVIHFFLSIPGWVANVWRNITNAWNAGMEWIKNKGRDIINAVVGFFVALPGRASNAWNGLREGFGNIMNNIRNTISNGINWIVDTFRQLPRRAMNALSGMFNIGKDAIAGFWRGLLSGLGSFANAVKAGLRAAGIKGLASGTNFSFGGQYLVGETGPEIVTLPKGSRVTRSSESRDLMKNEPVNITINNPVVRDDNDIKAIVEQVTQALNSTQRLKRLGV